VYVGISNCQKKVFSFPVAVNSFNNVGTFVFLLQLFVTTENFMKRPTYIYI
jgi:hypothetical protein